ncbi:MAG: hypothetical protein WA373_17935 [Burkholderiales bacterium]
MACAILIALATPSAGADQTGELARLREEAAQIRQSLEKLEARIQALENQSPNQDSRPTESPRGSAVPEQQAPGPGAASPPTASPNDISSPVLLMQNWSQVQPGTREDRVRALLGEPERALRIDGNLVWYYVYPGIGRGSVFFNNDGKVSTTQSPSSGWFR